MTRRAGLVTVLTVFAVSTTACGGSDETPRPAEEAVCRPILPLADYPDSGGGPVDCRALDGYELLLLDDFEPWLTEQAWYVNNDRTALQDPPVETNAPPHMSEIPGGRCAGTLPSPDAATRCDIDAPTTPRGECPNVVGPEARGAMHIVTGLLTNNGGQLGQTLARCPRDPDPTTDSCPFSPGPPEVGACSIADAPARPEAGCWGFDASAWDGIVLWARVGPGSQATVKVRAADKDTDDKGCVCNPYTSQNDSSDGCDKWGAFITLDQTFRAYRIPFTELQQGGWGRSSPGLDTANLFSIAVEYGRGAWDLWLDDIGFYRSRR